MTGTAAAPVRPRARRVRPPSVPADEPLPLYHRIYLLLRQVVTESAWPADQALPGEHDLASRYGVSRITIRRAMQQLESERLVERRRGSGTFVQRPRGGKRREQLRNLIENLLEMGEQTDVRLLEFAYLPASPQVAASLEVRPGTVVQKSVRVRSAAGVPFSHLVCWVPDDIGRRYGPDALAARPLLRLLEEAGSPPAAASQVISAQLADSLVAPLLGVQPGSALIRVTRQVRDAAGRVIEVVEALYRPDMYEYQFDMVRERGRWGPART